MLSDQINLTGQIYSANSTALSKRWSAKFPRLSFRSWLAVMGRQKKMGMWMRRESFASMQSGPA
jgi:hypothetical protein